MDIILEKYLDTIDKHLKPMQTSERIDIIKEIKSSILEMEKSEALTPNQITEKLGDPRDMAKGYLSDSISQDPSFRWKNMLRVIAFYGAAGFSGMFVIPILLMLAPTLQLLGILAPVAGLAKLVGFIFNFDVPFVIMQFGSFSFHPVLVFPISIIWGFILYKFGRGSWNLLIKYINKISRARRELYL